LALALKLSTVVLLFNGLAFGDAVSLVGGYAGALFDQSPFTAYSTSWPATSGYSYSSGAGAFLYSETGAASGDLTTQSLQLSASFPNDSVLLTLGLPLQIVYGASYSGARLITNKPVYLSESVTLNYGFTLGANSQGSVAGEFLQFSDSLGNPVGTGCSIDQSSTSDKCSTGLVFFAANSVISVGGSLNGAFFVSDSASFQGTATLGPLMVYDTNGNLLESLDLNTLVLVPEPGSYCLLGAGFLAIAVLVHKKRCRPTRLM
jgi:hypothetical protein